eukprot:jgi/Astpho2/549/Aster-08209
MGAQSKPPCARYTGKVAVVTASTAGIGLGIAKRLGQEGAKVVICSRKQKNVDDTLKTLRGEGIDCQGCACHVGSREHLKKLVKLAIDSYGRIDVLVSNAAVNPMSGPILDMPEQAIDKILEINVKSAILLCQEVRPHLQRGAAITFISSYTAFNPSNPIPMYAVSKTALLGLSKALAEELGQQGIRGVRPTILRACAQPLTRCLPLSAGIVPTKFAAALVENPELEQAQKDATLVKRLGRPEDMAAAVAYLCSDDASYVTGETIVVSGGLQSRL